MKRPKTKMRLKLTKLMLKSWFKAKTLIFIQISIKTKPVSLENYQPFWKNKAPPKRIVSRRNKDWSAFTKTQRVKMKNREDGKFIRSPEMKKIGSEKGYI